MTSKAASNNHHPTLIPISVTRTLLMKDVYKNLSNYSRRTSPTPSASQQSFSFRELYNRDLNAKSKEGAESSATTITPPSGFGEATESCDRRVKGGLPSSVFGKELRKQEAVQGDDKRNNGDEMKTDFVRIYTFSDLGAKLRELRPENETKVEGKGEEGEWSWLEELNTRLAKLRRVEEEGSNFGGIGISFKDLRDSLVKMQMSDNEKASVPGQKIDFLNPTQTFMKLPPQEHLVDKYFHPDNMSSAEKMKLRLQKDREEFKMSESDCGSARVQVAQLTTKINHLATALHKKDKHSRKGLQEMVVKRKKLLKYLRRTDWDSYCFVLSRLGLRDNPDYKH
ncbi:uncharacterized protein [Rutidosis leptorrhynchoides]|uniref:uncharacterized protein n=1 Tax=Rutidosis leptorrhynchoides TaxID=125765 RepID=UPI003A99952B